MMWFLNMLLVLMLLLFCRQVLVRSPPKHPLFSKTVSLPPVPFSFWRKRQALKRDGELIAFIRLYEMSQHRRMQLSSFCEYAASYLPLLRSDLLQFSQRLTLDGADQAFQWLQSRFPNDHPFAQHVFTYLQTSQTAQAKESSTHSGKRLFLEKLSKDFYERRKKANAPLFNLVNMLPSFLVFFMILLLLISYMGIVMEGMSL